MTGDLGAGRRLPAIHRLAALYGVSVPTAHAAIHILAALGFVRVSPGVGTFVRRAGATVATVNHGWLQATPMELALLRAAVDRQMPIVVAAQVSSAAELRIPQTLSDIAFLAQERAHAGVTWAEDFLHTDFAFHEAIARSVRGAEVTVTMYGLITRRLLPHLVAVTDVLEADRELAQQHVMLAAAILDGQRIRAGRLGRQIAERELRSLTDRLG